MMDGFFLRLRSSRRRDVALARSWHARAVRALEADAHADLLAFGRAFQSEPRRGRVVVARAKGSDGHPFWAGMRTQDFLALHLQTTGASGSGKSFSVLSVLMQILWWGEHPVLVFDRKNELATLLLDVVLPALVRLRGLEAVANLRVIRPFDRVNLPMLRITLPEEGISREIQAFNLAAALEEALADDLGSRMSRMFLNLTKLAIERNEALTVIQRWLEDPARFARDARTSSDPSLRAYARGPFARENRSSVDALLARMDLFFSLPEVRLALSAPRCMSFRDSLERGITIVDAGDPPAGAERAGRFWSAIFNGMGTRAILSRSVSDASRQALSVFEEFQEDVRGRHQAEHFSRLLALARYKKVALWFVNQQPAQIAAVDPTLLRMLRTNTGIEMAFRCSLEDARLFAHALPSLPHAAAEGRERLVEEMTRLPNRDFYLWVKTASFRAQRVRSPRLDLATLRQLAASVPEEIRAAIRRGTVSMSRAELEAQLAEHDARAQARDVEPFDFLIPRDGEGDPGYPGLG